MGLLQKTSTVKALASETLTPLSNLEEYPVPVYQFSVEIADKTVALFQSVSGLSVTRAVDPLSVGGENNFGREFPGHITYGHITLQVGLTSSDFFWKWMMGGQFDGSALAKDFTLVQRRPNPDGDDPIFAEVKRWNFKNAFPVNWKISDLSLDNSQKIVMESLELSFDYFELGK
jgi:phage tail-like protein